MKKTIFNKTILIVLLSILVAVVSIGCGKKAPPLPPLAKGNIIAPPTALEYRIIDQAIVLSWKHQVDVENAKIEPDAFEVFVAKRTFDDCEGCPFVFTLAGTVPIPDTTFSMDLEKGFKYYFRIQAVNEDNLRSDYSKTVQYENK